MRNAGHRKFIRVMQTLISVKGLAGEPDSGARSSPVRGGDAGKVPTGGNSPATYSTEIGDWRLEIGDWRFANW